MHRCAPRPTAVLVGALDTGLVKWRSDDNSGGGFPGVAVTKVILARTTSRNGLCLLYCSRLWGRRSAKQLALKIRIEILLGHRLGQLERRSAAIHRASDSNIAELPNLVRTPQPQP
jgi:hypothetical protein